MKKSLAVMLFLYVLVFAVLSAGCHVLTIRANKAADQKLVERAGTVSIPGIPFYAKTGAYLQTTEYVVIWQEVILRGFEQTGTAPRIVKAVLRKVTHEEPNEKLNSLRKLLFKGDATPEKIISTFNDIEEFLLAAELEKMKAMDYARKKITANKISQITLVDYERPLYLNAPVPLFGRANLSTELNADGSLSKAAGESETKLAEAIGLLLPVKEFLTSKLIPSQPPGAQLEFARAPLPVRSFELEIIVKGNKYSLSRVLKTKAEYDKVFKADGSLNSIDFDLSKWPFACTALGSDTAKEEDSGVLFSGKVILPKQNQGEKK